MESLEAGIALLLDGVLGKKMAKSARKGLQVASGREIT